MENKKISVIITSFNRGKLLRRAVESVLSQSYQNFELIVVDDASTDDETLFVLSELEKLSDKIQVIRITENKGANVCRNIGIHRATGCYYTGLDDDDYFEKNRLLFLVNNFAVKYSFICDNYILFDGMKKKARFWRERILSIDDLCKTNEAGNQIFTLLDRIKSINGFDETIKRLQDQDTWLRLIVKYGKAKRCNEKSYIMDISHEKKRITSQINTLNAYRTFFEKHRNIMTVNSLCYNKLRILFYSDCPLALRYFFICPIYFIKLSIKKMIGKK